MSGMEVRKNVKSDLAVVKEEWRKGTVRHVYEMRKEWKKVSETECVEE